tara:strand:- start:4257 stop:4754 length:498 start_codon:yes stop_codon:yes gene_type:complete
MKPVINNLRLVGGFFFILSLAYLYTAQGIPLDYWGEQEPFNARSLPYLLGVGCAIVSLLLVVLPSPGFDWSEFRQLNYLPAILLLALLSLYGLVINLVGFFVATTVLLAAGFLVLGEQRPWRIALISVGVSASFWLIMDLLGIYLSPGELFLELFQELGLNWAGS